MPDKKKPIGSILLKQCAVSSKQLAEALKNQRRGDPPLVSRLTDRGVIDEQEALKALSEQSGSPGIDLNQVVIRLDDLSLVPRALADRHCLMPVLVKGDRMFVAMADPSAKAVLEEIEMVTGKRVFPYIALKTALRRVIALAYDGREEGEKHYVGPRCSPEALRKAGVSQERPSQREAGARRARPTGGAPVDEAPSANLERQLRPSHHDLPAYRENPVVVDDRMQKAGRDDLPTDDPTYADLEAPSIVASLPTAGDPTAGTLLVVDADEEIRAFVMQTYRERGWTVSEADRGDSALRMVRQLQPDVVLLEATLPSVHGFDVARQLKGSERYQNTRVIMMSNLYKGWRIAEDLKANYGVDGFLEKPFGADDVIHAIERTRSKQGRDAPPEITKKAEPYLEAGIRAYKAGDIQEAVAQLEKGVKADPLAFKVHFHLGLLYGKVGQLYDGISELETALSIRSDHFPALKNLAVLYQNAGFRNKAIEMWTRCLSAAPDEDTREQIKKLLMTVL